MVVLVGVRWACMAEAEGVIKFVPKHVQGPPPSSLPPAIGPLLPWRQVLRRLGLLGQDPGRYDGLGFGNVSVRLPPQEAPAGQRRFAVSGAQTSGLEEVGAGQFAAVLRYDLSENVVRSRGFVLPSSESMTHAAIYDLSTNVASVFHVHSPTLWHNAETLDLPTTRPDVAYGTPAMAAEMVRLWDQHSFGHHAGLFIMAGHPDGVLAFGATPDDTGTCLLRYLERAGKNH